MLFPTEKRSVDDKKTMIDGMEKRYTIEKSKSLELTFVCLRTFATPDFKGK